MENTGQKFSLNKKQIIILVAAAILVLILAIVLIILLNSDKKEEYRIIKVYETEGNNIVTRDKIGEITAYENMVLENGDNVSVGNGKLTLKLDEDKYVYAQSNTRFELLATGSPKDSKTTINLIEGSIANDIQNKLSDDSYYEINTPNSTMSVRGTIYYVSTYEDENGKRYTKVTVFDGVVDTDLILPTGESGGKNKLVEKGKEIIIYTDEDETITDYVTEEPRDIVYDELPVSLIEILNGLKDKEGNTIEIPQTVVEEIEEAKNEGPFIVTFKYGDQIFATQEVKWGEKATKPKLQPAEIGNWNYDFSSIVKEDIEIDWK